MTGQREKPIEDGSSVDLGRPDEDRPMRLRESGRDLVVVLSEDALRVIGFSEAAGRVADIREDQPPTTLRQFVSERDLLRIRAALADAAEHGASSPVPFS